MNKKTNRKIVLQTFQTFFIAFFATVRFSTPEVMSIGFDELAVAVVVVRSFTLKADFRLYWSTQGEITACRHKFEVFDSRCLSRIFYLEL